MLEDKKQDAFEALVGDWIGEVGQLHQRIQELPVALAAALSPTQLLLKQSQEELTVQLNTLPGAADKEMKRAGVEVLSLLSQEVSKISQTIAGDAAKAEKGKAIELATKWAVAGVLVCAVVFGATGYAIRMTFDAAVMRNVKEHAEVMVAEAQRASRDEIEFARRNSGWIGTDEGRLAKRFFDMGAGQIAATCSSPVWEVVDGEGGKYCVPKRRELFGSGKEQYGWKIP